MSAEPSDLTVDSVTELEPVPVGVHASAGDAIMLRNATEASRRRY